MIRIKKIEGIKGEDCANKNNASLKSVKAAEGETKSKN